MEILVFKGYGGFNLPPKILAEYLGEGYYFYVLSDYSDMSGDWILVHKSPEEIDENLDDWHVSENMYVDGVEYSKLDEFDVNLSKNRNDPKLIELFYKYETELSEDYRVVEIPDDVNWQIHEKDSGCEYVEEVHRTW